MGQRVLGSPRLYAVLATWVALLAPGCSGADEASEADHHDHGAEAEERVGTTSAPLVATDSVATAVNQSCSTTAVKGLATQLVEEIQCLRPSTFARIDNTAGLSLGAAVFPFLQTNAASSLLAAQKARGVTMSINSGLRTLPQQYLLYRWYQTGRCGIGLAAKPGSSNHESALAIDINDNAGWRTALQGKGFRWLGASDPVHYDYVGGGTVDLRGLSVRAFQRLWNRNNATDKIAEDGSYGPATELRLSKSPVGGFAKGADCSKPTEADAGSDADPPTNNAPADVPVIPDATESGDDGATTASSPLPVTDEQAPASLAGGDAGCSVSATRPGSPGGAATWGPALAAAALLVAARRRRA